LYANFDRDKTTPDISQHLSVDAPYLAAFPTSAIKQLVILTSTGLNQGGNEVIAGTLYKVYEQLHNLVELEIEVKRENV
jgi:hypothetical protein